MRIAAKIPNSEPLPVQRGIGLTAAALEEAGFESLWVSDHVVMPSIVDFRYDAGAPSEMYAPLRDAAEL